MEVCAPDELASAICRAEVPSVNCEECKLKPAKYKCPACGLRSCGLTCVNAHKKRTSCTGKRHRTAFVPISGFDDAWLHSDFHFLEELSREADAAKRMREPVGAEKYRMTPNMVALVKQAKNRNIKLVYLAHGMTRRKANTSYYQKKWKRICWRIEWVFHSNDEHVVDAQVDENTSLRTAVEKHLQPGRTGVDSQLKPYVAVPIQQLSFFIQKEPCKADTKLFYKLHLSEPIGPQLACKCIIEFPVIHVALPTEVDSFPLVQGPPSEPSPAAEGHDVVHSQQTEAERMILSEQTEDERTKVFVEEEIEEGELV